MGFFQDPVRALPVRSGAQCTDRQGLHRRRDMEKMKDAVNAAAGGEGVPSRRIAGDAGREYILQTQDDTKTKAALDAGQLNENNFVTCMSSTTK